MKIALGSDHGGYLLKEEIKKYLEEKQIEYEDLGTYSEERTDHPIYAEKVAEAIQSNKCDSGILICRSGHGMTIVANKFKGIRAANVRSEDEVRVAKADDDVNVITLAGDNLNVHQAVCIIRIWIATEFKGGRYGERLQMLKEIEKNNMK